jgi:hypothetical protein
MFVVVRCLIVNLLVISSHASSLELRKYICPKRKFSHTRFVFVFPYLLLLDVVCLLEPLTIVHQVSPREGVDR